MNTILGILISILKMNLYKPQLLIINKVDDALRCTWDPFTLYYVVCLTIFKCAFAHFFLSIGWIVGINMCIYI